MPMPARTATRRWLLPAVVVLLWIAAAGPLNLLGARLTGLQENDNAAFLPDSAESTRVTALERRFATEAPLPVLHDWEREGGLPAEARTAIQGRLAEGDRIVAPAARIGPDAADPGRGGAGGSGRAAAPPRPRRRAARAGRGAARRGPGAGRERVRDRAGRDLRRLRGRVRGDRRAPAPGRVRGRA